MGATVLAALQPVGMQAVLLGWEGSGEEVAAQKRLAQSALAQAPYKAERAQASSRRSRRRAATYSTIWRTSDA